MGSFAVSSSTAYAQRLPVVEEEEEEPVPMVGLLDPSLAKPLMTLEEEKRFRATKEISYRTRALKSQSPSRQEQDLIEEGVAFRVKRLTIPENWANMGNRTRDLVTDIDQFADASVRAREAALKAAVKELGALLASDQPTVVKINAAWLLGRLNVKNQDIRTRTPAVPYPPASKPLIDVLGDSQQRLDVKVAAVRGLGRILDDGDPSRSDRDIITKAFVDDLNRIDSYPETDGRTWYHWRLIDALGKVEFPRSVTQETYVADALWKTMHDESLPWHVRTRAVRALGQIKLDGSFNIQLVMYEVVLMTGKMTAAYNNAPNASFWRLCFGDIYYAFKGHDERHQQRGWGFTENPPAGAKAIIDSAYTVVLPIVNAVLKHQKPQPVPNKLFADAADWLKNHKPNDRKLHSRAEPLPEKAAKPAKPDPAKPPQAQPPSNDPNSQSTSTNKPAPSKL